MGGQARVPPPLGLGRPGLFITATDTGVGKTVTACAIAAILRRSGLRVGVCKPIATGCRHEREGLVSEDAEALAHFADCRFPLDLINPVRYQEPLAPAAAAERSGRPVDWRAIAESLTRLDRASDVLLVEGIGGAMVPLDECGGSDEGRTILDLAAWIGFPVLVVTRSTLGTLNHTAMTCTLIRQAGLRLAGLVVNRYRADSTDLSEQGNLRWLAAQNNTAVLACLPLAADVAAQKGLLPAELLEAAAVTDWLEICKVS